MKKIIIFVISLLFVIQSSSAFSESADLAAGDKLSAEHKYLEAIAVYQKALDADSGDYQALAKMSRSYSLASNSATKKSEKKDLLENAIKYAREAIKVNKTGFEGHLYLSNSMGKLSDLVGSSDRVKLSREIGPEAEKAIKYNPADYEAYMILGIWHRDIASASGLEKSLAKGLFGGLPEASLEESETYLKKAVELKPEFIEPHYELALTYKKLKEKDLAKKQLAEALKCPISGARDEEIKKKVQRALK